MKVFVTGGAGFIGSNLLQLLVPRYPDHHFVNVDKLTYAANPASLSNLEALGNYALEVVDIADREAVEALYAKHEPTLVIHLAAESHVDKSILGPEVFIQTNVLGTFNLLEGFKKHSMAKDGALFHHVSTDEVYGSLGDTGLFTEQTRYDPSSPYSASKASSDHLVRAYGRTYDLPFKLTNCSNTYGPRQFPEKLIALMILNAVERKPLPIYGEGLNVRDWLYVTDHCEAIWAVIERGTLGETYNIGGNSEKRNVDVVHALIDIVADETGAPLDELKGLITYVQDRPGHDHRYAIDATRIAEECDWRASETFESGMRKTVKWYLDNTQWVEQVRSGEYLKWIEDNYGDRLAAR